MQVNLSLNKFFPENFKRFRIADLLLVLTVSVCLIALTGKLSQERQTKEGQALSSMIERFSDELMAVTKTMAKTLQIKEEIDPKTYDPFDVVANLLPSLSKAQLNNKQVQCLAENIYYEARGQNHRGWLAVAEVTMNRVKKSGYPDTICGVVHQRTPFDGNIVCQFSWTCESLSKPSGYLWHRAQQLAAAVYFNPEDFPVVSNGATHFHATSVKPGWKLPMVAKIQDHVFYKKHGE